MPDKGNEQGLIFCLCGPAGAGKNRLAQEVVSASAGKVERFITSTSRAPRAGEVEGRDYHFLSREQFEKGIAAGEFFEYEEVHGNFYGPSRKGLEALLASGKDVILVVDIKGCLKVKRAFPERTSITFVTVPSLDVLRARILARSTVSPEEIERRMQTARAEFNHLAADSQGEKLVDFVVLNDRLEDAVKDILAVTRSERLRACRASLTLPV